LKITHIRIRVLRSRPVGYGHDAAEIEAQLEEGDDPDEVTAELRRRCEAAVRQGAEQSRIMDKISDAYDQLRSLEEQVKRNETQVKQARDTLHQFDAFIQAAAKAGVHVPQPLTHGLIPF